MPYKSGIVRVCGPMQREALETAEGGETVLAVVLSRLRDIL